MASQILSKRNAHVLARFAAADVLVALDYDGTLAPIVSTPRKARMRPRTRQLLAGFSGVAIEDKTSSVTVHYRTAKKKGPARRAIAGAVGRLRGARVIGGSQAFNVVPRGAPHKGQALECARRLLACEKAIY